MTDGDLIHIGDILAKALEKYRPARDMEMVRIWDVWDTVVPPDIAGNAKPSAFKDGTLMVTVSSSAWLHHLKFLEKDMIAQINARLDSARVSRIRARIGTIHS